ncbi:MAG: ribbon-helix-helix protein, CopG family [Chromatiales bacterium]|jgi:metal-responsive CopG/Arc/MetJ family transcriptional regulator|nr:ribbon-helix-helix protein, CopG family [Chromatiales bacterium]MDX9768239.1 ribbon-helix-helix protein, CopG family [Ectothiorhodospiraceae bacterium]
MRTVIDLPDDLRAALDRVSREDDLPRAELVRRALRVYLKQRARKEDAAFGLWKGRAVGGVDYQRRLRDEWED